MEVAASMVDYFEVTIAPPPSAAAFARAAEAAAAGGGGGSGVGVLAPPGGGGGDGGDGGDGGHAWPGGPPVAPCVAVGLATEAFPLQSYMPGWTRSSYGYHGDDGSRFHSGGGGRRFGPRYGVGDTVGCGLVHCAARTRGVPGLAPGTPAPLTPHIFYTLNGAFLGVAFEDVDTSLSWYPCVGLDSPCVVHFNVGSAPFVFDLPAFNAALWRTIAPPLAVAPGEGGGSMATSGGGGGGGGGVGAKMMEALPFVAALPPPPPAVYFGSPRGSPLPPPMPSPPAGALCGGRRPFQDMLGDGDPLASVAADCDSTEDSTGAGGGAGAAAAAAGGQCARAWLVSSVARMLQPLPRLALSGSERRRPPASSSASSASGGWSSDGSGGSVGSDGSSVRGPAWRRVPLTWVEVDGSASTSSSELSDDGDDSDSGSDNGSDSDSSEGSAYSLCRNAAGDTSTYFGSPAT